MFLDLDEHLPMVEAIVGASREERRMGATHVTVTIRNPADPDRAWEGLFRVDPGVHRLSRSTTAPRVDRSPAQGPPRVRDDERLPTATRRYADELPAGAAVFPESVLPTERRVIHVTMPG